MSRIKRNPGCPRFLCRFTTIKPVCSSSNRTSEGSPRNSRTKSQFSKMELWDNRVIVQEKRLNSTLICDLPPSKRVKRPPAKRQPSQPLPLEETYYQRNERARGIEFEEEGHVYRLGGDDGLNSSASSLLAIWRKWGGGIGGLKEAISDVKDSSWAGGYQFRNTHVAISDTLVRYLNLLAASPMVFSSYRERAQFLNGLQEGTPKDFYGFVPSSLFESLELHYTQGGAFWREGDHESDIHLFARMVSRVDELNDKELCEALKQTGCTEPLSGEEVAWLYGLAADCGTALHKYLEERQQGKKISEVTVQLREKEDYEQCERYLAEVEGFEVELERRGCCEIARLCGSIDCLIRYPSGGVEIVDYKRSKGLLAFAPGGLVSLKDLPLSHTLVAYAIQMAAYHKILRSEGETPIDVARLVVFHPLQESYFNISLDLTEKLKYDDKAFFKGLGIKKYGEMARSLSPLEVVELICQELEREITNGA